MEGFTFHGYLWRNCQILYLDTETEMDQVFIVKYRFYNKIIKYLFMELEEMMFIMALLGFAAQTSTKLHSDNDLSFTFLHFPIM